MPKNEGRDKPRKERTPDPYEDAPFPLGKETASTYPPYIEENKRFVDIVCEVHVTENDGTPKVLKFRWVAIDREPIRIDNSGKIRHGLRFTAAVAAYGALLQFTAKQSEVKDK